MSVSSDLLFRLVAEHGPWALMVFYLLFRDHQREQAVRRVLDRNTTILTEMTTMIRERLPRP